MFTASYIPRFGIFEREISTLFSVPKKSEMVICNPWSKNVLFLNTSDGLLIYLKYEGF